MSTSILPGRPLRGVGRRWLVALGGLVLAGGSAAQDLPPPFTMRALAPQVWRVDTPVDSVERHVTYLRSPWDHDETLRTRQAEATAAALSAWWNRLPPLSRRATAQGMAVDVATRGGVLSVTVRARRIDPERSGPLVRELLEQARRHLEHATRRTPPLPAGTVRSATAPPGAPTLSTDGTTAACVADPAGTDSVLTLLRTPAVAQVFIVGPDARPLRPAPSTANDATAPHPSAPPCATIGAPPPPRGNLVWRIPLPLDSVDAWLAARLTVAALGAGSESLLYRAVRHEAGLSYGVSAHLQGHGPGAAVQITAETRADLHEALHTTVRGAVATYAPQAGDIARARKVLGTNLRALSARRVGIHAIVAGLIDQGQSPDLLPEYAARLAGVSDEAVIETAARLVRATGQQPPPP